MTDEQHTERLQMRVPPDFIRKVDDWRRTQSDIPSRSEAIRLLVNRGTSFDAMAEVTETIAHLGVELIRGIKLSSREQLQFLEAIEVLIETVDGADDELKESIERLKRDAAKG